MKLIYGIAESGKYGGWIKPEQFIDPENSEVNVMNQVNGWSEEEEEQQQDVASAEMFRSSRLEQIFRQLGRKPIVPHPAAVSCGEKPKNASKNCDVKKSACLYDISKDPCEYNNLAHQMPHVVKMLQSKLNQYSKTMVPPRSKPVDPASNPKLFGGVWTPWVNLTEIKHSEW